MTSRAAQHGDGKFASLFSLTGYLNLYQKGIIRNQYRRYWFWFDEKTCSLNYYKTQDTYLLSIHEPVGSIDLRYAKVTPGITGGASSNKNFHINVNGQISILSADDPNSALNWIQKLQEKRSEYIKCSSAREEMEQERGRRTMLLADQQRPMGMLGTNPATPEEVHPRSSPSTVRRIMNAHIPVMGRHSVTLDTNHSRVPIATLDPRRSTMATSPSFPDPALLQKADSVSPTRPQEDKTLEEKDEVAIPSFPLTHEQRENMQLAHSYYQSQEEVTGLQKEVLHLQDQLASKDREIEQLKKELLQLSHDLARVKTPHCDLILENDSLKDVLEQYRRSLETLDGEIEVHKLSQAEHGKRVGYEKQRVYELDKELNSIKAKYVRLLSENFKIVVSSLAGPQEDEQYPEDDKYTNELLNLVKQEGGENPAFENYNSNFEDQYGDLHDWQSGTATQHYLCRQLYLHYTQQEQEKLLEQWHDYIVQVKKVRSYKTYTDFLPANDRTKKKELRTLIRRGVPIQYRRELWISLTYRQVGKLKEVRDTSAGRGKTYYQALLTSKAANECEKQIELDLYRTLPNNRHFKQGGDGALKLQNVLLAYSMHNPNVGYCQGMNMLAAIGLLFLDEETAFWFMVTLIEKLLPQNYFTPGLLGAQADQAVVRELVENQLPLLHTHLHSNSIDVTLVTFNWFLTLFVDALPTESVLHILDCFLMEGHKILFRVSLGILKINERRILSKTDPVTIFQLLKEIARHSFDVEQLLHISFNEFPSFPNRSYLSSRHQHHLAIVRQQWVAREKERALHIRNLVKEKTFKKQQTQLRVLASSITVREPSRQHLVWECGCVRVGRGEGADEVWLCCGDRQQGRIGIIHVDDETKMEIPITDVGSRVICIQHVPHCDVMLLGTLDFILHAIDCKTRKEAWSIKMNDSILDIKVGEDCNIYAALADGFIAVLQNACSKVPDSDPILLRIGSTSVSCLALAPNQQLWCGCGKAITVVSAGSFEPVQSLVVDEIAGKVYKMEMGKRGIWVSFRSSSVVCLFDSIYYVKLMQVDYTTLLPGDPMAVTEKTKPDHRITSMMEQDGYLWLGTGNGNVHIFSSAASVSNPLMKIRHLAKHNNLARTESEEVGQKDTGLIGEVAIEEVAEVSIEKSGGEDSSPIDVRVTKSHYEHRRKTAFGRTIRQHSGRQRGVHNRPSIYKLIFQSSRELLSSKNESVRVLLSLRSRQSMMDFAVSCVHSITDWQKGIQVWQCATHSSPSQWMFDYLSPPPEDGAARKRAATSSTALPPSQLQVLLVEKSTELQDSTSS